MTGTNSTENPWFAKLRAQVREEYQKNPEQSLAHREDHVERVFLRAMKMADTLESVWGVPLDREVLGAAALLHDIQQPVHEKHRHATLSAERAEKLLGSINFPREKIPMVRTLILEHSSEDGSLPTSPEAKILFDADKLDGLGALGIARVFVFCGHYGVTPAEAVYWYKKKIEKALPMLQTELGKEMGKKDFEFVREFLERFEEEWGRF